MSAEVIRFRNGDVEVSGGVIRLMDHSTEHHARISYPFDYKTWSATQTPCLNAFLAALFADVPEAEGQNRIALIQKFAGACLVGDATRFQKCLILYGSGGNGKTELLNLLRGLFPFDKQCMVVPRRWGSWHTGLAALEGSLANFVDECPTGCELETSVFKDVIDGNPVSIMRRNKEPHTFTPQAGHIYTATFPLTSDDPTLGVYRRMITLPMTRTFPRPEFPPIFDPHVVVLGSERTELVAWALDGAARAQQQNGYSKGGVQ